MCVRRGRLRIMRFRLVTYNIHKGIGGIDRRYRLERIVDTIQHCAADVVMLQEVDRGVPRSHRHDQAERLAELLGFPHWAYQLNVHLAVGGYGNAILSRLPLVDRWDLELKIPLKKRRRGLAVELRTSHRDDARSLLVYNVHLGLAGFERRMQLRRLLNCQGLAPDRPHVGVIVGGDFNDAFNNLGRQILEPAKFRCATRALRTFPAILPVRPLDRVYFRGALHCEHAFVCHTQVARQASDHLPLVIDFALSH